MGAAVAQRPGAEGAKSGDIAWFDLSTAQPSRKQPLPIRAPSSTMPTHAVTGRRPELRRSE